MTHCGFETASTARNSWRALVQPLLGKQPTPFYLFSAVPIEEALTTLDARFGHLPLRHWLSFKTQPLKPLVQWWRQRNRSIEVVSEFEFLAARAEGFVPERILINGPAKHHWLPRHGVRRLNVNLDSLSEAQALAQAPQTVAVPAEGDTKHGSAPLVARAVRCRLFDGELDYALLDRRLKQIAALH